MATKTSKALNAAGKSSTSVAVKPNHSVVNIKDAIKAQVAAMGDRIAPPSGSKIKLSPNKMTLPDGTVTPGPLEVVIVDFTARNYFYAGIYDKDNIQPPVCFAIGPNPNKLVPSPNSPEPQAKSCAECPMNAWGSNGKGKACKNERNLAVLPPDAEADAAIWTLSVPPTGVKGFDGYVANVMRTFETPPFGVVTTVTLDPTLDYPLPLFGEPTPNPHMVNHFARQAEATAMLTVEPDLSQRKTTSAPTKRPAGSSRVSARR